MKNSLLERFQLPYHDIEDAIIIGVDFGDGEYAAARAFVSEDGVDLEERLKVSNGRDFTEFAVYGVKEKEEKVTGEGIGKTYVTQDAVNRSYANFKRRPGRGPGTSGAVYKSGSRVSLKDFTYEYLMSHAFSYLVDTILRGNENLKIAAGRTETRPVYLFVGRPSSARWEETEQAYAEMLAQNLKTYPNIAFHVAVVSEAKAAMASEYFSYRNKKAAASGGGGPDIQKETIAIIDGGSSTFDCVVVRDGQVICEYSRQVGAGKLDKNLLDIQLFSGKTVRDCAARLDPALLKYISPEEAGKPVTEASVATRTALREAIFAQRDINGAPRLEYRMGTALVMLREAKESYFGPNGDDGNSRVPFIQVYTSETGTSDPEELVLRFHSSLPLAVSRMAVAVEPSYSEEDPYGGHTDMEYPSFEAALEAFYQGARATWERNGVEKPDRIIVTGGATLMPFVNEIMERVFETKEREIAISPPSGNRHYSVSTGVAYIGFVELYKEKIYQEVCKECDGFVQAMRDKLREALLRAAVDFRWYDCLSWVDTWANDQNCTSFDDLSNLPHPLPESPWTWNERVHTEVHACILANLLENVQNYLAEKTRKLFPNAKNFLFALNADDLANVKCPVPKMRFSIDLFRGSGLIEQMSQKFEYNIPILSTSAKMDDNAKKQAAKNVRGKETSFRSAIRRQTPSLDEQITVAVDTLTQKLHKQMETYVERLDDFFIREDFKRG